MRLVGWLALLSLVDVASCKFPALPPLDEDGGSDPDSSVIDAGVDGNSDAATDAAAPIVSTYQSADLVLGQGGFTTETDRGYAASSLTPMGIAADATSLYVGDASVHGRVMVWSALPTQSDVPADRVIGRPSLTDSTATGSTTATNLGNSAFPAMAPGLLWISDSSRNRVIGFSPIPTTNGPTPNAIVGQTSYIDAGNGNTAIKFFSPADLWTDGNRLAVADRFNQRVMIWTTFPASPTDPADLVLGQPSFGSSGGQPLSASSMSYPTAVHFDGTRFYVADRVNSRVMIWNSFPTTNNQPADVILGQPTPIANAPARGAAGMNEPQDVVVVNGALFVADTLNDRVLVFDPIPTATGAAATYVLGQPDFAAGADDPPPTATSLDAPTSLAATGRWLFVADTDHKRVVRYTLGR